MDAANKKMGNNGIRDEKGQFLPTHPPLSPGRPKGSRNKFTLIKDEMAEIWTEAGGKKRFRKLFVENFPLALKYIVAILPKKIEEEDLSAHGNLNFFMAMCKRAGIAVDSEPES